MSDIKELHAKFTEWMGDQVKKAFDAATKDMAEHGTGAIFLTIEKNGAIQLKHVPFNELRVRHRKCGTCLENAADPMNEIVICRICGNEKF